MIKTKLLLNSHVSEFNAYFEEQKRLYSSIDEYIQHHTDEGSELTYDSLYSAMYNKFLSSEELYYALINTHDTHLIYPNDNENKMGYILMKVRDELTPKTINDGFKGYYVYFKYVELVPESLSDYRLTRTNTIKVVPSLEKITEAKDVKICRIITTTDSHREYTRYQLSNNMFVYVGHEIDNKSLFIESRTRNDNIVKIINNL
jgi:hypothetical protein